MDWSLLIAILLFVVMAMGVIASSVKIIGQSRAATIERFGRYTHTLNPGLNLIIPFIDRVGYTIDMRERVLDIPSQEVITRDNANVRVDAVAFIQVVDASRAAYATIDIQRGVNNLITTAMRSLIGEMSLDELLSSREKINSRIMSTVDEATDAWGVKTKQVDLRDIKAPEDLTIAMNSLLKADRNKRAEILEAEGVRQAAILKAEGEKQAAVLSAEGEKQSAILHAEAREREAEAEANATKMVSDSIASGDIRAIQYFVADKVASSLSEIGQSSSSKVLLLPHDASSLMGSIAGISEIFNSAASKKGS